MTEISQTADGQMIVVRVTLDGVSKQSLCSSMHLVADHTARLTRLIQSDCEKAFIDVDDPLA